MSIVYGSVEKSSKIDLQLSRLEGSPKDDKYVVQWAEMPQQETDAHAPFQAGAQGNEAAMPVSWMIARTSQRLGRVWLMSFAVHRVHIWYDKHFCVEKKSSITLCYKTVFGFSKIRLYEKFQSAPPRSRCAHQFHLTKDVAVQTTFCIVSSSALYQSGLCSSPISLAHSLFQLLSCRWVVSICALLLLLDIKCLFA